MDVTSHIAGRLRIRDEGLKKEALLSQVTEALLAAPGVTNVEANPRVGSLLILYSAAVTGMEKIQQILSGFLGAAQSAVRACSVGTARILGKLPTALSPRVKRIAVNVGMLASLVVSLAAAMLGLKKLHILAGVIYLAIFGTHLFERRRFLFA